MVGTETVAIQPKISQNKVVRRMWKCANSSLQSTLVITRRFFMMVGTETVAIQPKISQNNVVRSPDIQMSADEPFHFLCFTSDKDVEVC
jgi:hypothetical protein